MAKFTVRRRKSRNRASLRKRKPKPGSAEEADSAKSKDEKPEQEKRDKKKEQARDLQKTRLAHSPLEGRGPLAEPKAVLIQNATVWTCGPDGRIENADVLIAGGKIKAVGKGFRADSASPPLVIDGNGLHVTPGLIDCHSHSMILGGVNEGTLPSTA